MVLVYDFYQQNKLKGELVMVMKKKRFMVLAISAILCLTMVFSALHAMFGAVSALGDKVTLSVDSSTIVLGNTIQVRAKFAQDVKAIIYKANSRDVVSIDNNGVIKALKEGKVQVYATDSEGTVVSNKLDLLVVTGVKPGCSPLTISDAARGVAADAVADTSGISLSCSDLKMGVGERYKFDPYIINGISGQTITWSTSDSNIVTVESNGEVKAVGVGKAFVTAMLRNGSSSKCDVTVVQEPLVAKLDASEVTLGVGESYVIQDSSRDSYNKGSVFSIDDQSVGMIQEIGEGRARITAKGVGETKVKARTYNGKIAECKVTVKNAPTGVTLSALEVNLVVGEKFTISQILPEGCYARSFSFTSDNNSIADVKKTARNKAEIVAKGVGNATITLRTYNDKTAECKVSVKEGPSSADPAA